MDRFYAPQELILTLGTSYEDVTAEFRAAVREVAGEPGFPLVEFSQKLFAISMALENLRMAEWEAKRQEENAWHDAQAEKLGPDPMAAEVKRYVWRTCVRLLRDCKSATLDTPCQESLETGTTIRWVIDALGGELLPAAPLIRHMLNDTHQSCIASGAICRMGTAAREFLPDLLAGLRRDDPNSDYSRPLGVLLRSIPDLVRVILAKVDDPDPKVRANALNTLGHCGRDTLRDFPEVEARLMSHLASCASAGSEEWYACAHALGELAITDDAVSLLLQATHPPDGTRTAAAIYCLGRIGSRPEWVVPRLIELLDQFSEPDPDWMYHGAHSRIVDALSAFGTHAQTAIQALIARIWDKPESWYDATGALRQRQIPDKSIVEFLGSHGEAAVAAVPELLKARAVLIRQAREEHKNATDADAEEPGEEDFCPEFLTDAISRIQAGVSPR